MGNRAEPSRLYPVPREVKTRKELKILSKI